MFNRIHALYRDPFFRHNAIFFVGSMLVAVLNYLYHPIVSRMLTVEEFGEVQAFLSLAAELGVITSVFGMIALNIKANLDATESDSNNIAQLYTLSIASMAFITLALLAAMPFLSDSLGLVTYAGFFMVAGTLLLNIPRTFARFGLQAEQQFTRISIAETIVSGGKIIFALLFISMGFLVGGALAGFLFATLVSLAYMYPRTKNMIGPSALTRIRPTPALWRELRYGMLILFATGFATFMYTADIIVVRYFFDAETAGLYAGIATVARIVIFATGSIAGVLIAHIKIKQPHTERHAVLRKAMLLTVAIAGGALAVFALFPAFVVDVLMGERFLPAAGLLPMLGVLMFAVAIVNVLVMYFLALRRYALIPVSLFGIAFISVTSFFWHDSVEHVIMGFIGGILSSSAILAGMYVLERRSAVTITTSSSTFVEAPH